jgi:colanic acid biosynthesis glycosyl transferase WcaI
VRVTVSAVAINLNARLLADAHRPAALSPFWSLAHLRIIAVNRFYRPDHSATAQLLGDLAEHLAASGHEVVVLASRLRYEGGARLGPCEHINGVEVRRIWTTHFGRASLVGRALDYITFYISAFLTLVSMGRRSTLVIAKTDPPLMSVPAGWACRLRGMRLINWCQDVFPEIAGALGLKWAKGPVGGFLRWARNRSLRLAATNVVLNDAMASRLMDEGILRDRITIIPNWPDKALQPVHPQKNALRTAWGYGPETFVIGYSGNLGRAHRPDDIARLIRATAGIKNLAWLFIGGGAGLAQLKAQCGGLRNIDFRPYQPLSRLSESLCVPDAHLISLDPDCEGLIMPSKLYGVVAIGRPVIALGRPGSGLFTEIARLGAGQLIDCEAPVAAWLNAIRQVMAHRRDQAEPLSWPAHPAEAQVAVALHAWSEAVGAAGAKAMRGRPSTDVRQAA